jgi:hypothetical protein
MPPNDDRDPREVYAERVELAAAHRLYPGGDAEADRIIRWAMSQAMYAGLFFDYADLHPLQKALIADQHDPDLRCGFWRFVDGRAIPLPESV